MEQTANRHNLIGSYVFTALVVAALVAVYLLTAAYNKVTGATVSATSWTKKPLRGRASRYPSATSIW